MPTAAPVVRLGLLVALALPCVGANANEPLAPLSATDEIPAAGGLPVVFLGGLRGGWTGVINSENRAVVELSYGALARFGQLGAGLLAHFGKHGDVLSYGADAAAGPSWVVGQGRRLDALATIGVQYFDMASGRSTFLFESDYRGGYGLFPVYGLKLTLGPDDAEGFTLGLYVMRTFRDVDAPYQQHPECPFGVCTWSEVPRSYGGTVAGLVVQYGATKRIRRGQ